MDDFQEEWDYGFEWRAQKQDIKQEIEEEIFWMMKLIYMSSKKVSNELYREIERRMWIAVGILDHDIDFPILYELYCLQRYKDTVWSFTIFEL